MAKKKIVGQSKLSKGVTPASSTTSLQLVTPPKTTLQPTSFRLTPEDKERLQGITSNVNELSPNKKISETMIVRALLFNGIKMKPEKLIRAIREVIL